jgi:hypothetical protein
VFGGLTSGLHIGPTPLTDVAAVLEWAPGGRPYAVGAVPLIDYPEQLTPLAAGEVLLYGPTGSVLLQATATYPLSLNTPNGQFVVDSFGNVYYRNNTGGTIAIQSDGTVNITPGTGKTTNITTGGLNVTGNLAVSGSISSGGTTLAVP